ncbi:MAG: AsmA-like C-terminal region-containing protein [bacterium]|nr:AsmA-like C-terminal region-containing protein [bacterium]
MKRWLRRVLRIVGGGGGAVVVLLVLIVLAIHSSFVVRRIVVPIVNRFTPYHVSLAGWRLRLWSSLALEGLRIQQISPDDAATNVLIEVHSLDVRYTLPALLDSPLHIDRIIIDRPVIGLAARPPEAPAEPPTPPPRPPRAEQPIPPPRLPNIPVPVAIGELRVRNARITYFDLSGTHADITGLSLTAQRIGPHRRGSLVLDASLAFTDGHRILLSRVPLSLRLDTRFEDTIIPSSLTFSCTASNLLGRLDQFDVTPLTLLCSIDLHQRGVDRFELSRCDATLRWQNDLLAFLSLTGSLDVAQQLINNQLMLKLNASPFWQALLGPSAPLDISDTRADVTLATLARADAQTLTAQLSARLTQLRLRAPDGSFLPPLDLTARTSTTLDLRLGQLALPDLLITAAQHQRTLLTARTLQPVTFCWKTAARRATSEKASLELVLDRFDLSQLNAFLRSTPSRFNAGVCSARATCDVVDFGSSLAARGSLSIGDLNLQLHQAHWNDLDLALNWAANLSQFKHIVIDRASAQIANDNIPAGQIALGGFYDLPTGTNRLALAIAKLSSTVLQPLLDPKRQNPRLAGLDITLQLLTEKADPSRKAQQIGLDLAIENTARRTSSDWDKLRLNLHAALRPDLLRLPRCTLDLQPARFSDNKLSLHGEVMLVPTNAPTSLTLSSPQFDATVLLDTFMPPKPPQPTPTPRESSPPHTPPTTTPAPEPPPLPLYGRDASVRVRIEELRARELLFLPLYLDLSLNNGQLTLRTPELRLNGGRIDLSADADLTLTGYAYRLALSLTNLPLQPIFNTFTPDRRDTIDGLLATELTLAGRGIRLPSLSRNLRGSLNADMTNGRLVNVPVLSAVGRALHLEALENYTVGDALARISIHTGIVHLTSVALQGPLARISLRGNVTFAQQLDLMMHLALTAKGITDLLDNKLPFSGELGRYYDLPLPIPITGTFKEPQIGLPYNSLLDQFMPLLGLDPRALFQNVIDKLPTEAIRKELGTGVKMIRGLLDNIPLPPPEKKQ